MSQPRVRANDWSVLRPPGPGEWTPSLRVSVVIPAYRAQETLPFTLGALGAQTYPAHLLEVIVVDDSSEGSVDVPADAPPNTRVVRPERSWGRATACHAGALAAGGDVVHWLDADMVPLPDEVERQLRWHHLIDHAVVLGHKTFVDPTELPPRDDVLTAIREDRGEAMLAGKWQAEHAWVERFWRRTQALRDAGFRAYQVHVGASASVRRELYFAAGGMDTDLKLGEDVELGFRLQMCGAVFVADRSATSLHLGRTTLMRRKADVERYNAPHIAQRLPDLRKFRKAPGRGYLVPWLEVVVDVAGRRSEEVVAAVDGVLASTVSDLVCQLVGPWQRLRSDERRSPLDDPELELRLVREQYAGDPRVRFVEEPAPSAFPAAYRLVLPAGWVPAPGTLGDLVLRARDGDIGLCSISFADGTKGRLESTAAWERARRLAEPGEDLDDVVGEISGTWSADAAALGFHPAVPQEASEGGRPADPAPRRDTQRWSAAALRAVVGRARAR